MAKGVYIKSEEHKRRIGESLKRKYAEAAPMKKIDVLPHSHETTSKIFTNPSAYEESIRPESLADFIGHANIKRELDIILKSSTQLNQPIGHILLTGAAGTGKTSLASIIAREAKANIVTGFASSVKKQQDVIRFFNQFLWRGCDEKGRIIGPIDQNILILDEIHQLPEPELFFSLMEDRMISIKYQDILSSEEQIRKVRVQPWCLIGLSNRAGELPPALLERFKYIFHLETYEQKELQIILFHAAHKLGVNINEKALAHIAESSKGIPRIAIAYLERCRNVQLMTHASMITDEIVSKTFSMIGLFEQGLTSCDVKILSYLYRIAPNKIGINRLASLINETPKAFANTIEPFLSKNEFIITTPSGRTLGRSGAEYLKKQGLITLPKEDEILRLEQK
mgnify:CR=1 FL=1